ncbi:acetylcholinesterase [Stachybotrys elegans]|uniref:Carboxylic ester hydrolase n=1 Tax=Stachybotrys elegans TaxID=80388 RepID=A0A8K0SNK3_9HYPO|nr:acetylcholinesterase [Stachybotrys elegans]
MRITQTIGLAALLSSNSRYRTAGGLIHGTANGANSDVRQFLGIPYAQPPLGALRFSPPRPALPFGELDAKEMPPSCMQFVVTTPNINNQDVLELNLGGLNGTTGPISEDCLTLSIWAPRGRGVKDLPVLVWFYGGGFATGGTDVPYQNPSQWVQRTQSHIIVAFNQRDNIFGYPNAAGLPDDEQNIGLLDQRLAVEWVRDNIAAFGGDPTRIGLWGHSSGACCIAYYSFAWKDDPIANSVILHSGNEFVDILNRDPLHSNFTYVASQLGCGDLGPAEELSCMRKVDGKVLADFIGDYYNSGESTLLAFTPVEDNRTIFPDWTARALAGEIARLPALIGTTAEDGVPFAPYNPDGVDTDIADMYTMFLFFCPSFQAARNRIAALTGPVYRYIYSGNFTNISPRSWMGAWHGAELPMLFGTHPNYRGNSTPLEYETSHAMQDAWLAFVATAGRTPSIQGWDAWNEVDGGQVAEFGNDTPVQLIDTADLEANCGLI